MARPMRRIIALVDHSLYAESVVDHAAWLGRSSGRSIDVVHVIDPVDPKAINAGMAGLAVGGPGIVRNINHTAEKLEQLRADAQLLVDRMTTRIAAGYHGVVLGGA
jgi:nucleotide-binding universal stress UspA family protein